ncbi:5'/3'-nucleotidase SurE [Brevibacillus borstelensis]|uniref:5'/3'-nucleotidase SurE n=1 Tax=Brevibacillus borstelensis TaxID=45462 RepID=UPI0030BB6E2E
MLRVLLTNDDGIDALGIRKLAEALLALPDLEIFVVAPAEERSGVGHGLTYRSALSPTPHSFYGLPVTAWTIDGNPADCIKGAYHLLFEEGKKPDIVFSGINVGTNLGRDIYYSGTCSGAREAVILGIPGAALSYDNWSDQENYGQVEEIIRPLLQMFCDQAREDRLAPEVFWNVNIPHLAPHEIRGVAPAALALNHYEDKYNLEAEGYWLTREYPDRSNPLPEQDYYLVKRGYIAVTPVHIDATDRSLLDKMLEWPLVKQWGDKKK